MTHIDEHILELYVLGSEKVKSQRRELEEHLLVCHGCRELVEKILRFYADADEELKSLEKAQPEATTALVQKRLEVTPYEDWISPAPPRYPLTRFERFQRFARRHPVVTGAGSFAAVAIAAALINFFALPKKDANPTAYLYNTTENKIEIYNREGDKLWSLGDVATGSDRSLYDMKYKRTVVSDLDGDGVNEIITTSQLFEDHIGDKNCLRVFGANGEVRFKRGFMAKFVYLNRIYSPLFDANYLLVFPTEKNSGEDIFVTTINNGRSPSFLARLDRHGTDIGKYWHFGELDFAIDTVGIAGGHQEAIIICGQDDTADSTGGEFPFVAVLDPTKIISDKKSTASPGFQFPLSDAELFYVKLPTPEVNVHAGTRLLIRQIRKEGTGIFSVYCTSGRPDNPPSFYFYFTEDMHVAEVKPDDQTNQFYRKLHDEGKISYTMTREYLENLKTAVRYWDGKQWRKEVVRVNHE